jgi:cell wall assembly regulator SMI1
MPFDAARFDGAWERYIAAIENGYPAFRTHLNEGASAEDIASAEIVMNVKLPDDLQQPPPP